MKKFLLTYTCIGLSFCIGQLTYAQTQPDPVNDLSMRFCNGDKKLSFEVDANEQKEICYVFANNGNTDRSVTVEFVDGTITNDASQNEACQAETYTHTFGQFVTQQKETFFIPAHSIVEKKATIKFPNGHPGGELMGCLAYYIDQGVDANSPLSIRIRKGNIIKTIVHGTVHRDVVIVPPKDTTTYTNEGGSNPSSGPKGPFFGSRFFGSGEVEKKIATHITNSGDLEIKIHLTNSGSIPENVYATGTITDMMGNILPFETATQKIMPGETNHIRHIIPKEQLPFYKGNFDTDIRIHYSADVDERIKENFPEKTFSHTENFVLYPEQDIINNTLVGIIVLLGSIVYIVIQKKRKKGAKKILLQEEKKEKKEKKIYIAKEKTAKKKTAIIPAKKKVEKKDTKERFGKKGNQEENKDRKGNKDREEKSSTKKRSKKSKKVSNTKN